MRFILPILLLFSFTCGAVTPQELEKAIQFPVEKYQLKNGLTVLLHPDASIPAISVQQWFRVGSKDEVKGRTGLAHFFEHMMFKGTKKFGPDTWGKFLNSKGADMNAFTSEDYTGYYINAPSEQLALLLEIESDRMRNLKLDPKDVASEREVVKEERRMRYDDSIEGGIHEKMAEIMYTNLPYHWLPIGSMADLNAASMEDLHKFYKTFYSPGNAVLVVAGAFKSEEAKKLIEKYYGGIAREEITRPTITPDPAQKSERRATIEREAQAPTVAVGYRLPELGNKDHYALDLLSIILGRGQSSRLHKQLVYKSEIALGAYASSWGQVLAGQFNVGANLKPKVDTDRALKMIEGQVKQMRDKLVTQKELDKARNILMKDYVDGLKRVSGRAHQLASYEILFGDYKRIFSDLKEYQAVTTEDIRRVAKLYLQPNQRNIVIVHPRKPGGAT
jgi:zinc protease